MRISKTKAISHDVTAGAGPNRDPSTLAKVWHVDSEGIRTDVSNRPAPPTDRTNSRILDFLAGMGVMLDLDVTARKQALEAMAMRMATVHGLNAELVFRALWRREQAASTGIGHGIALPHARIGGIDQPILLFARTRQPISSAHRRDSPYRSFWPLSFRSTRATIICKFSPWR